MSKTNKTTIEASRRLQVTAAGEPDEKLVRLATDLCKRVMGSGQFAVDLEFSTSDRVMIEGKKGVAFPLNALNRVLVNQALKEVTIAFIAHPAKTGKLVLLFTSAKE